MKNRITGDTQFCVGIKLYEQAVRCYWVDKCYEGLWRNVKCFNELPQAIREIYFEEADRFLHDLAN